MKGRKEEDFLQSMTEREEEAGLPKSFLVDNIKTMFVLGGESASVVVQWVLLLLAHHPEWQGRVRSEVMSVSGGGDSPTLHMIGKMTLLTQVIQETLRLSPLVPLLARQVFQDVEVGGLHLPKGTCLVIPTIHLNYDTTLWGSDADQFRPERFSNGGVAGACRDPHLYMPFGNGVRTCLGRQHFAMVELKIVLSMMLARFKVSLSPNYRHSPSVGLVLEPKYGVQIMAERV